MRLRLRLALPLLLCLLSPLAAPAVVIATGDGSGNTSAPPDDPGFANVGVSSNNLSGVYLGNGWVLTAAHVGNVTGFRFGGVFYDVVPGSRRVLSQGGTNADLAMLRLGWPRPPLPEVVLASTPIAVDEVATLIGHGWNREAAPTCWTAAWAEVACPGGVYEGYARQGSRSMRWGLNRVSAVGTDLPGSGRTTRVFELDFDAAGETHEAQVVTGDSGGGAFVKRAGEWELVGIHVAMGAFSGQPLDTAVFGNMSLLADVHHYRSEIEALLSLPKQIPALPWPAPLLCAAALLGAARTRLGRASARSPLGPPRAR